MNAKMSGFKQESKQSMLTLSPGTVGKLVSLPPIGGKSADVDRLLVVGDLKAQGSRAEIEYLRKVNGKLAVHFAQPRWQKQAHLNVARHAAGDDLLAVVGEGHAEHHLVVQVVEHEALERRGRFQVPVFNSHR